MPDLKVRREDLKKEFLFTHFSPIFHFYIPWFSGGIEMEHWSKMN